LFSYRFFFFFLRTLRALLILHIVRIVLPRISEYPRTSIWTLSHSVSKGLVPIWRLPRRCITTGPPPRFRTSPTRANMPPRVP
jgi:hypothetical protein